MRTCCHTGAQHASSSTGGRPESVAHGLCDLSSQRLTPRCPPGHPHGAAPGAYACAPCCRAPRPSPPAGASQQRASPHPALQPGAGQAFPRGRSLFRHQLQPIHPFHTLPADPPQRHRPPRRPVLRRQRLPVEMSRQLHAAGCTPARARMAATATPPHYCAGTIQPASQTKSAACACAPSASTSLRDSARGWATRPFTRSRQSSGVANPAGTGCAGSASRRSGCSCIRLSLAHHGFHGASPRRTLPHASPAGTMLTSHWQHQFAWGSAPFSPAFVDNPQLRALALAW